MPARIDFRRRRRRILSVAAFLALCACKSPPAKQAANAPALAPQAPAVAFVPPPPPRLPTQLLTLQRSAYHLKLDFDGSTIYLLANDAIFAMSPDEHARARKLDLGFGAAATTKDFVYWSSGAIWRVPKQGGDPVKVVPLASGPQYFVTSGDRLAWIDYDADGGAYAIRSLRKGKVVTLHALAGALDAAAMAGDRVAFVERARDQSWRVGSVSLRGEKPVFTSSRTGRTPAMLVARGSDIYYYDSNTSDVHVLSSDLRNERTIGKDVVCSPMAVADRIYCARVEGLFALSISDGTSTLVSDNQHAMVTALAADDQRVAWVTDRGAGLEVSMLPTSAIAP